MRNARDAREALLGTAPAKAGEAAGSVGDAASERDADFVTALARGLDVLASFDAEHRDLTLSQVAARTALSRGTARRFLITLERLGFLSANGKQFRLTAKILELGGAYLSSFGIADTVRAALETVAQKTGESSSLAVLEGSHIVYVARANAPRTYATAVTLNIGSRLPAYSSSLGRVLLSGLDEAALDRWLAVHPRAPVTSRSVTDAAELRTIIRGVRRQGYCVVRDETEIGLLSLAVPVMGRGDRIVAALNTATLTARTPIETLRRSFLPVLQEAASEVGALLRNRG